MKNNKITLEAIEQEVVKESNMIDDKAIMAAANEYNPDKGFHEEMERISFMDGAAWFKQALWHDASEKPVMSELGIILVELNNITACKYSLWWSNIAYECLCDKKGYIRRWLYLEDLLPK